MHIDAKSLVPVALEAGRKIMNVYADACIVADEKSDGSPVTIADKSAEDVITSRLATAFPDIPVIAEEAAEAGHLPETRDQFFLVDPLDGTREFISRNGEFTVNIALILERQPVLGIVYAPAMGELYFGSLLGEPSAQFTLIPDASMPKVGMWQAINCRVAPQEPVAVGSRRHGADKTGAYLGRLGIETMVNRGSSLKFCMLATGKADIYPRLGRTMEWDTAAGHAILSAAGGGVSTLDGNALIYNKCGAFRPENEDSDFANPYFVAFGDRRVTPWD